ALEVGPGDAGIVGEGDVLATRGPGAVLGILTADCAPAIVWGDEGLAVVHAGWRGLVAGVVVAGTEAVGRPRAAWVGPCIHACCYEVGPEVVEAFGSKGLPTAGDDRVDIGRATVVALRRAGVQHIAASEECTGCDASSFFSHRRDGTTGRQGAFATLLEES
ncbi:MAG: polyphenol oxidase family protein, partial [Actinomycetota bacterium]